MCITPSVPPCRHVRGHPQSEEAVAGIEQSEGDQTVGRLHDKRLVWRGALGASQSIRRELRLIPVHPPVELDTRQLRPSERLVQDRETGRPGPVSLMTPAHLLHDRDGRVQIGRGDKDVDVPGRAGPWIVVQLPRQDAPLEPERADPRLLELGKDRQADELVRGPASARGVDPRAYLRLQPRVERVRLDPGDADRPDPRAGAGP